MRRLRARTAAALLNNWSGRKRISEGGTDILNLFELVAYLVVRSKTLRLEDAWTNFSGWALSWWYVYLPGIEADRAVDHTLLEDYAVLIDRFIQYEATERGLSREEVVPTEQDLLKFLQGEVKLLRRLRYSQPMRLVVARVLNAWTRGSPRRRRP